MPQKCVGGRGGAPDPLGELKAFSQTLAGFEGNCVKRGREGDEEDGKKGKRKREEGIWRQGERKKGKGISRIGVLPT